MSYLLYTIRINPELPFYFPALMGSLLLSFMKTIYLIHELLSPRKEQINYKPIKQSQVVFPPLIAKWLFCSASDYMTPLELTEASDHNAVLRKYIND